MSRPIVVVGDALLDIDLTGTATRLAPDAPVPVVTDVSEQVRPGGAALAALLAARDGHSVVLVIPLADDAPARRLLDALDGVHVVALPYDGGTPVKQRVRSGAHSLLRIDTGGEPGTIGAVPPEVASALESAAGVLVSDYGRGATAHAGLRRLLSALSGRVPLVWDPHPRGAQPVPGAHLATPNAAEARQFAASLGVTPAAEATPLTAVCRDGDALVAAWRSRAVAVTRGASGALLTYGDGAPVVTPAPHVVGTDPCGAGDRFAVSATAALAAGAVLIEAVQAAVQAASAYVAAGGPASLAPHGASSGVGVCRTATARSRNLAGEDLAASVRASGGVVVATGGCFDLLHAGHVATLRAARELGDCLIVCVNSDDSVRRLKGPSRPLVPADDRVRVLEALECVDAVVVFDEDTPAEVLQRLRPHLWAKGGDYAGADVPEAAVLRTWGGQAVVLPYLAGRSTSALVADAASSRPSAPRGTTTMSSYPPVHSIKENSL